MAASSHEPARSYACEGVGPVRETCFARQLTRPRRATTGQTPAATVQGADARPKGLETSHETARSYACEGVGPVRETCFTRRLTSLRRATTGQAPSATVHAPDARPKRLEASLESESVAQVSA